MDTRRTRIKSPMERARNVVHRNLSEANRLYEVAPDATRRERYRASRTEEYTLPRIALEYVFGKRDTFDIQPHNAVLAEQITIVVATLQGSRLIQGERAHQRLSELQEVALNAIMNAS